jgi:serine/threonine protein kinase/DNA-binding beta-propeller fold protein YncE
VSDNPSGPGDFVPGTQIAGYRLEEQIGRGGMAVVYRALDARLDRRVALKILAPALAQDDAFRQRFIRESRAAAAVDHPHIIPVFEAGEANGVLFIAMRYVRGGDVRSMLDAGGPLPGARAAEIITQVASALDAAHAFGLVHRDVKPGNMLLDSTSGGGRQDHVYLSDFGLSKQSLSVTGLTSTGQFLGTLDYVAPEQIEGRPVDGRADLYALACAAFEMLSGSPPFRRDQGLAVVWAQLSEPPPSIRARRQDLPPAVDAVFSRAMAKSPPDRYPTCLAFAAALREALGLQDQPPRQGRPGPGGTVLAGPPSGPRPPRAHPPTETSSPGAQRGAPARGEPSAGAGRPPSQGAGGPAQGSRGTGAPGGERSGWAAGSGPGGGQQGPPSAGGPPTQAVRTPQPTRPGRTEQGSYPPRGGQPPQGYRGEGEGGYRRRRPWWRTPAALIIACVIVLGAAGGAFAVLGGGKGNGSNGGGGGSGGSAPPVVKMPGCNSEVAKAKVLQVRSAAIALSGNPFGVFVTANGKFTFVTLGNSIALFKNGGSLAPTLVRTFSAPGASKSGAFTHDGEHLIVAASSGALVINVAEAEEGFTNPITGTLTSPYGHGAVEVAISPDDKFVFVTLQSSAAMVVFNLATALTSGFGSSDIVGKVTLGQQPVGMAISPDHKWLYATSMTRIKTPNPSQGTLTVMSLQGAETKPSSSIVSIAPAGCSPVRVVTSADGSDVWVTSRESDALLGFSATRLRTNPKHALIARVNLGTSPIGLIMIEKGSRMLIANSNVHSQPGAISSLAVVDTSAALAGKPALLGIINTGLVPREFAITPDGKTLLATNDDGHQVQAIDVSSLP